MRVQTHLYLVLTVGGLLSIQLVTACSSGSPADPSAGSGGTGGSLGTGGSNAHSGGSSSSGGSSAPGGAGGASGGSPVIDASGAAGAEAGGASGTGGTGSGGIGVDGGAGGSTDSSSDSPPSRRDAAADAPASPVTVFVAGDSTVQTYVDTASPNDQAGWGQMLQAYFRANATVDNRAIGGRTARRFIEEGRLDDILADLRAGDYLLVQFGTNDSNTTATYDLNGQTIPYFLDANTDFKTYLMRYVDGARSKSATPVLVTPPPRNSAYCTGGNGLAAYAQAMRDLAAAQSIALDDLNAKTVAYLRAICPAPTPEDFFLLRPDGTVDGTHFQENGARILARFVADGIRESGIPLAQYLQ
jgi:lysophospholipase L1-like esterase